MPRRTTSSFARLFMLRSGMAVAAFMLTARPAGAQEQPLPTPALHIASWNISEAPDLAPPKPPPPPKSAWRTTFGSERRTEHEPPRAGPLPIIDADVVLLQGIADATTLRRLFPARLWRLVVSRQMFMTDGSDPSGDEAQADEPVAETVPRAHPPATAIAVRVRDGIRVTGQQHLVDVAQASLGAAQPPAPTAVRLLDHGRSLWILSGALPEACSDPANACPSRTRIEDWRQSMKTSGEPVVVGGLPMSAPAKSSPAPACAHQSVEGERVAGVRDIVKAATSEGDKGCIARLDVPY